MNRADEEKRAESFRIINNEIAQSIVLILEMKQVLRVKFFVFFLWFWQAELKKITHNKPYNVFLVCVVVSLFEKT